MSHRLRRGLILAGYCLLLAASLPLLGRGDDAPADRKDEITNSIGMKLKLIKPGKFLMGSPKDEEGRFDNEGPQHEVEITKAFYMGVYPVTKGQFAAFVKDEGYQTDAEKDGQGGWGYNAATRKDEGRDPKYTWKNTGWEQTDAHPVVNVTWNDANAFCAWLSKKEGKTYALPTEAEWEYACRAGTTTRFWCGGTDASLKGNANIADTSLKGKLDADYAKNWAFVSWDDDYAFTSPVGSFKPNPWGLYDMHGNVWQWCADGYDKYQEGSIKDPKGKESAKSRVLRGSSWLLEPRLCRSADRFDDGPAFRDVDGGCRVVMRVPARTP
jgi:sulfatase modifying factor 1